MTGLATAWLSSRTLGRAVALAGNPMTAFTASLV